ncbi:hypothetical protein Ddc_11239 [Ditylenchus destructor]|nr:hypothetical protein Ddc_11239 [Ditylenchus destructor]
MRKNRNAHLLEENPPDEMPMRGTFRGGLLAVYLAAQVGTGNENFPDNSYPITAGARLHAWISLHNIVL